MPGIYDKTDVTQNYIRFKVCTILIYFHGETRTRKWFTPAQAPHDREMTLEVLHDLEKWKLAIRTDQYSFLRASLNVFARIRDISWHNENIRCKKKKTCYKKTYKNLFSMDINISAIIDLCLYLNLHIFKFSNIFNLEIFKSHLDSFKKFKSLNVNSCLRSK